MNINRQNYETYFLLYIDGELTPADMQAVEDFVAQHTDLQAELNMLMDTKLVDLDDDTLVMDKSILYKQDANSISTANCEEKFLLYVDKELNATEQAAVEKFVLQHPATQPAFVALKSTVLPIEHIECPNKEALYKKTSERPVVYMWFRRLGAVAAIFLFGFFAWTSLDKTNPSESATATAANASKKNTQSSANRSVTQPETTTNIGTGLPAKETVATNTIEKKEENLDKEKGTKKTQNSVAPSGSTKEMVANNRSNMHKAIATQPKDDHNKMEIPATTVMASNTPKEDRKEVQLNNEVKTNTTPNTNTITNTLTKNNVASLNAQPVVYKMLNTDEEETNKEGVYIGNLEIKKSKLKNLFKKAKKTLTASKEDNG